MGKDDHPFFIPKPAPEVKGTDLASKTNYQIPIPLSALNNGYLILRKSSGQMDGMEFSLEALRILLGKADPVLGNSPDIDLGRLETGRGSASRVHAEIIRTGDEWIVRDLGSTNGTFINGRQLAKGEAWPLKEGDRLRLGLIELLAERRLP
jgi:hypothetical protein